MPRKLVSACSRHQSSPSRRGSSTMFGIERAWRCRATKPMEPCPNAMVRSGKASPMAASEKARTLKLSVSPSATHTDTTGTPMRAAAARAIPPRTSSVSSEEEMSWLTRASERRRSACWAASRKSRECSSAIAAWPVNASATSWSRRVKSRRARNVSTPMMRSPTRRGTAM